MKKYIAQQTYENFVYPNNNVQIYDNNDVVQVINNNSVSGVVNNFNYTILTTTGATFYYNLTWSKNNAEDFIRNDGKRAIASIQMLPKGQTYFQPWRTVSVSNSTNTTGTTVNVEGTFSVTASEFGLPSTGFTEGNYTFEIKFIGAKETYPVTVVAAAYFATPTPTPTFTVTPTPTATFTPTPTTAPPTATPTSTPCPTYYELSECSPGTGYAFTTIVPDLGVNQRYILPSPYTVYLYTGANSVQCSVPPGYNGSIQRSSLTGCTDPITPTPTIPPAVAYGAYTGATFLNSGTACADPNYPNKTLYVPNGSVIANGGYFYIDAALTTLFVGDDNYYHLYKETERWACTIGSGGYINNVTACTIAPTVTPTSAPPTATPTPLPIYTYVAACSGGTILGYILGEYSSGLQVVIDSNCYVTATQTTSPTGTQFVGVFSFETCCPTPTPTTTPMPVSVGIYTGSTFGSIVSACNDSNSPNGTVYLVNGELLSNGDTLYADSGVSSVFVGNDNYYKLYWNGQSWAANIDMSGLVSELTNCSSITPTPTPLPPTATPTSVPPTVPPTDTPTPPPTDTPTPTPVPPVDFDIFASPCNFTYEVVVSLDNFTGGISGIYESSTTYYSSAYNAINGSFADVGTPAQISNVPTGTWYFCVRDAVYNTYLQVKQISVSCPTPTPLPPTPTPTASPCRTFEIIAYNEGEYVDGTYTSCSGFPDSFSFSGGPGPIGTICAVPGTITITTGNGASSDVGAC
jgi:hypothetical protein